MVLPAEQIPAQVVHTMLPVEQIPARVVHTMLPAADTPALVVHMVLPVVQIAVWMVFLSSSVSFSAFSVSVPELVQLVLVL